MKQYLKSIYLARFVLAISLILAVSIGGCGGGTGGTGVKTYEGNVRTLDTLPLQNARISIEGSNDFSLTDNDGNFTFQSEIYGPEVNFLLETSDFATSFTLTDISKESSRVSVDLVVDPASKNVKITQFSVRAAIVGACEEYFTSGDTIEQLSKLPSADPALCTLEVRVYGDGLLRRRIPVVLQHSSCEPNAPWTIIEKVETGDGDSRGIAKISFEFSDSADFCRYRILAPFEYRGFNPIQYPIHTLQE